MCEIKRAVLVSLQVSLPCARSCFTCNANRYLQNKNEQSHIKHEGKRGKYFNTNANSGFDYMFLSLFGIYRSDVNFLSLEAK